MSFSSVSPNGYSGPVGQTLASQNRSDFRPVGSVIDVSV